MYELKVVELSRGQKKRKRLTISFHDSRYQLLEEFLMADAPMLKGKILEEIDLVLSGEKDCIRTSGNRTSAIIKQKETVIHDIFADIGKSSLTYPSVTIATSKLKTIIDDWLQALHNFNE